MGPGLSGQTDLPAGKTGKILPAWSLGTASEQVPSGPLDRQAPHLFIRCGAFCQCSVRTPAAFITAKVFSRAAVRHASVGMA